MRWRTHAERAGDPPALARCDTSHWHHMQCGVCWLWWAIEHDLVKEGYFCPHCGQFNSMRF